MDTATLNEVAPEIKTTPKPHVARTWEKRLIVVCPTCRRKLRGAGVRKLIRCGRCGGEL
jgi:hypothetical protein